MISLRAKKILAQSEELILSIVVCFAIVIVLTFSFRMFHERISQKARTAHGSISLRNSFTQSTATIAEAASLSNAQANSHNLQKKKALTITAKKAKPVSLFFSQKSSTAAKIAPILRATKLIQSASSLSIPADDTKIFEVGFKNSGTIVWKAGRAISLRSAAKRESYFYDATWESKNIVTSLVQDVLPGQVVYFSVTLHAPQRPGTYAEQLYLSDGMKALAQTQFSLPVTVTPASPTLAIANTAPSQTDRILSSDPQSSLPSSEQAPQNTHAQPTSVVVNPGIIEDRVEQEKSVRVGLFAPRDAITITSQSNYEVRDGNGTLVAALSGGMATQIQFDFTSHVSTLIAPNATSTTDTYFRFQSPMQSDAPENPNIIFEIPSYGNSPAWNAKLNDNVFRSRLEVRYAPKTDRLWVINELPLEQYLKGVAETSNGSPQEFQKALIVAARTYAKYHIERATKYLGENFMVRATDADQVYRGYNTELRMPNVSRAVDDTRGIMAYYNNTLAITPYFSQSDGRTRSWGEVWYGSQYPWLIGRDVPEDAGLPMLGHGVGMSAHGALVMAAHGRTYEEILNYFYTGIELHRRY